MIKFTRVWSTYDPISVTPERAPAAAMQSSAVDAAVTLLAELRIRGERAAPIDELPADCRPQTLEQAYRIQRRLRRRLGAVLGPPCGWKIGCTTPVMQQYLNIPHPCAGTLYRDRLYRGATRLRWRDYFRLGLECEIAVRLAEALPARRGGHSSDTVADAVGGVMASIEIVEHRFEDLQHVATASLVADDFFSAGCALGAERPLTELGDLGDLRGGFVIDGEPAGQGRGDMILGQPLNALAWLADHAAAGGEPLAGGEVITLGSVVKTIYPPSGTRIEARFQGLDAVAIEIV